MSIKELRSRLAHLWRQELRSLIILALVLFSLRSSLADWNDVPTGSMKPTILEGDRIVVNKLAYDLKVPFTTWHIAEWSNPERGDIVVFYSPYDGTRLVKRVVGLPGDTVELRDNNLILNGRPVRYEPLPEIGLRGVAARDLNSQVYASEALPGRTHAVAAIPGVPAKRTFDPLRVPEDQYFVMGDNRDNSFDSRFFGPVERKRVVGRASAIALSLDRQSYWRPRWSRFFVSLQDK